MIKPDNFSAGVSREQGPPQRTALPDLRQARDGNERYTKFILPELTAAQVTTLFTPDRTGGDHLAIGLLQYQDGSRVLFTREDDAWRGKFSDPIPLATFQETAPPATAELTITAGPAGEEYVSECRVRSVEDLQDLATALRRLGPETAVTKPDYLEAYDVTHVPTHLAEVK